MLKAMEDGFRGLAGSYYRGGDRPDTIGEEAHMTDTSDNHPEEVATGEATPVIPPTTVTRTYDEAGCRDHGRSRPDRGEVPEARGAASGPANHMRARRQTHRSRWESPGPRRAGGES